MLILPSQADAGCDATHLAAAEADRAMSLLKQAVTAGFKDVAQMKSFKREFQKGSG